MRKRDLLRRWSAKKTGLPKPDHVHDFYGPIRLCMGLGRDPAGVVVSYNKDLIVYKKTYVHAKNTREIYGREGYITTLKIPAGTRIRLWRNPSKCYDRKMRAAKALVISHKPVFKTGKPRKQTQAGYDKHFKYTVGRFVTPHYFSPVPHVECEGGIHFFPTKKEARYW